MIIPEHQDPYIIFYSSLIGSINLTFRQDIDSPVGTAY